MKSTKRTPKSYQYLQMLFSLLVMASLIIPFNIVGAVAGQVDANNVASAPTINGTLSEAGWSLANTASKSTIGTPNNTVTLGAMWDSANLYVGVKVLDGNLYNDSANVWEDDSVEIYIDANNNKGGTYDAFDRQYVKGYNDTTLSSIGSATGVTHAWAAITGGYSVELAIPWSNLGVTPTAGMTIGFDVGYNDDDNAGTRDSQAVWWGTVNNYNNTSGFGSLVLQPAGGATNTPTKTAVGPTFTPTRTLTATMTPVGPTATSTATTSGGQAAYPSGVARAVPGTIQAEDFDTGGETVAYHDLETANQGGQYRTADGVDIEATTDTGGGYSVGYTRANEWMEYTVNVASAGNYTLTERVASGAATGQFRVEFNGVDKTGVVSVPNTGGWQTFQNLSQTVSLSAGVQVMRIFFTGNDTNLNYFSLSTTGGATPTPTRTFTPGSITNTPTRTYTPLAPTATFTATASGGQSAYPSGIAWAVPGTIQAENFDNGGETVAYHDLETANQGAQYRLTDGVDIEASTDTGGGYNLGWTRTDEWVEYTINVSSAGTYTLIERVASGGTTGQFRVEFGGVDKTGVVSVPNTGGWQTFQNLSQTVSLSAGVQVMRIYFTGNDANINYFSLSTSGPTNTPTRTPTPGGVNHSPNTPAINEPNVEGKILNPGDVHMETSPFSDPDAGQTHVCSDFEIWTAGLGERVWFTSCIGGIEKVHTHLGDGVFQGSLAGKTELLPNTNYTLRMRHKDSSGDPATEWSAYATRGFTTASTSIGNPNQSWSLPQAGYEVQVAATGFQLPVNIAFIPNPGTLPTSPFYYVTELYGIIKVVTRAGTVSDYATGLLNFNPTGNFPGTGEQGVTGVVVDPATGDLFASMLYEVSGGNHYPKVVRFHSTNGGMTAATQTIILDMAGETQGQSHQISNLSFGPDGKLYVHMGDGFDAAKGQDLASFRGKILRINLDGSAPSDNPLYNAADGITARDYVFAYGFRNPFGGAWRASDNMHYEVENGPSVDRFARVVSNRNYLYNGTDASMANFAIYSWNPSRAPVNITFIQTQTFNGSGFPASKMDHAFVSESGPTYTTGPQTLGKRIVEFVLDANGNLIGGPTTLLEYSGVGKASVVALTAGPDGLYFSDLYKNLNYVSPIDRGANIYRLKYVGP